MGISTFLSAGNRADVSGNDMMQFWEDDADTAAVGLYLESIGNPRKFSRLARRLARTKPVIVAKSDAMGLQLPPGHAVRTTQAPAGALDAMMRQAGVIRVETIEQLMDVAQIVSGQPLPAGAGHRRLQQLPGTGQSGRGQLPPRRGWAWNGSSPTWTSTPACPWRCRPSGESLPGNPRCRLRPRRGGGAAPGTRPHRGEDRRVSWPNARRRPGNRWWPPSRGILDPSIYVEGMVGADSRPAGSVPCYSNPGAAVAALAAVVRYAEWLDRDQGLFVEPEGCDPESARAELEDLLRDVRGEQLVQLDPATAATAAGPLRHPRGSLRRLRNAGRGRGGRGPAGLAGGAEDHGPRPAAPAGPWRRAAGHPGRRFAAAEHACRCTAPLEPYGSPSLEVQTMAPVGQACTFRAIEDPLLGPVVSFGLAGDAVNLLDDWAHRVPPLSGADVHDFIRAPRASRKLFGYQGLPAVDVAALEDLAARLTRLKDNHPEIALVEFNPVLAGPGGASILSADVRIANAAQRTDSARRAMRS